MLKSGKTLKIKRIQRKCACAESNVAMTKEGFFFFAFCCAYSCMDSCAQHTLHSALNYSSVNLKIKHDSIGTVLPGTEKRKEEGKQKVQGIF